MKNRLFRNPRTIMRVLAITLASTWLPGAATWAAVGPPGLAQFPLNQIAVPEPPNLFQFVKNKQAAIRLGKALFWDMQAGSDGVTACATCHFEAGIDTRRKNTVNPGTRGGDNTFQAVSGPNAVLGDDKFPFHLRQNADFQASPILRDFNDVVGSQGVKFADFVAINAVTGEETVAAVADPLFQVAGANVRRVTARNTPTNINAVFNFHNFWDGRAHFIFNGENPFGPLDTSAGIWVKDPFDPTRLVKQKIAIESASLASQAVGPPMDDVEMSARNRTFPQLGRKMLAPNLVPLGKQAVHPGDSELGLLSRAVVQPGGKLTGANGLNTTYRDMITAAFQPELTSTTLLTTDGFTQMEANFSLFWGLAIQLYEATLVSDQTPFDRLLGGDQNALTTQQETGMNIFFGAGKCNACHTGTELSSASVTSAAFITNIDNALIDQMPVASGLDTIYDIGFNATGVRKMTEDIGRGGKSPFTNPLTGLPIPLDYSALAELQVLGNLPFQSVVLPPTLPANFPVSNDGAFKVPGLRNIELTAPYFHDGSVLTLEDVVDFYTRAGNFPSVADNPDLDFNMTEIGTLQNAPDKMLALVEFMKSLTDERVRNHSAPFDHPELFIPNGDPNNPDPEALTRIPARDANGTVASSIAVTINAVPATTNKTSLLIGGTKETGSSIQVRLNNGTAVAADTTTDTTWSSTVTGLVEGANSITVIATDAASATTTLTAAVTVDSTPPALTINTVATPTKSTSLAISGTVEAGLTPVVAVSTSTSAVPVTLTGTTWSAQLSGLAKGTNNITVVAIDPAGNVASKAAAVTVVLADGILSGTGTIAINDALKALRLSLGVLPATAEDMLHGDVAPPGAPDGKITVADALLILRAVAGLATL